MGFDPVTMLIGGAAVKAVGSIFQGEAASQAADYNAQVAQQNAVIAQQQGAAAAEAQSRDAQRKIGSMVAGYGASGVEGSSGSPMDVLADSARMATLDNLTTKYNYALKAQGFGNSATLDEMNSQTSLTSGVLNAVGTGMSAYGTYTKLGASSIPTFG